MSRDEKEKEMIYGLTADERDALQAGLNALPDTMPPRAVWHRIREQAEAEGLISKPRSKQPQTWYMGGSIAAALLVVALIVPRLDVQPPVSVENQVFSATPTDASLNDGGAPQLTALQALMVESRQLENDLRSLGDSPRVVRAGTQATILELEDRIAAIDYQLNDPATRLSPEDEEIFWRERVRLMKSLVQLRTAQAQRAAF